MTLMNDYSDILLLYYEIRNHDYVLWCFLSYLEEEINSNLYYIIEWYINIGI